MNRITEITKRDILDLFQNGLEIDEFFQTRTVTYNYYGRLEEIDFLKRLYDLERMPSFDSRFANAEQDIWQHTVNNDDYPYCWVFEDKRFNLQDGSDEVYLKFLCEVFHPAVRYDKGYWKEFLVAINKRPTYPEQISFTLETLDIRPEGFSPSSRYSFRHSLFLAVHHSLRYGFIPPAMLLYQCLHIPKLRCRVSAPDIFGAGTLD